MIDGGGVPPPAFGEHRAPGGYRVGSLFGVEIALDASWFIILVLIFWSLSGALFPSRFPELGGGVHALMGLAGTLLFFGSLVAHEIAHALVSRRRSVPVEGITLFLFGGVARIRGEPRTPKDEILIAGVGPVVSLALAAAFIALARLGRGAGLHPALWGVADYLAYLNLLLALFNLLPGFPLDGGRILRATVWAVTADRLKATRWAATGGRWLGTFLMVLGAVQALGAAAVSGVWLVLIGWFLRRLAGTAAEREVLQKLLDGWTAADAMVPVPEAVPARLPLERFVREHLLGLRSSAYPVVEEDSIVGVVTPDDVERVPPGRWGGTTTADVMLPLDRCLTVSVDASLAGVLEAMERDPRGRAVVVDHDRVVGVLSAVDVALWTHRARTVGRFVR